MSTVRIIYYVATSVDGYIADEDGSVDWLEAFESDAAGGAEAARYIDFFESVDCLVMGATTYEQVLGFGEWPYDDRPTYVFTHRDLSPATDAVEFVEGPVSEFLPTLRGTYDAVWLVGGGQLARAFLDEDAVDELRLSLVPVLLGGGVRLFDGGHDRRRLRALETTTYDSGIVEHRYEVRS